MSWTRLITLTLLFLASGVKGAQEGHKGDASMVYETLGLLQESVGQGNSYIIREADLNAFLKAEVSRQAPPAIKALTVELGEGLFTTKLSVDMDALNLSGQGTTAALLGSLLSGVQELVVVGAVAAKQGKGGYSTHEAALNGVTLPATLVDLLLSTIGQRLKPPFDPTEPFRLPNGIQSIEIFKGRLELTN